MIKKNNKRSDCPISHTLDLFGDRWTLLILRDAIFRGYRFYKEFLEAEEKIATNILSNRLKMLEAEGFMVSKKYEKQKTKKVYQLTERGISLIPLILEMIVWGFKDDPSLLHATPKEGGDYPYAPSKNGEEPAIINRMKNDKESLIKEIEASIRNFDHQNFC